MAPLRMHHTQKENAFRFIDNGELLKRSMRE